MSFIEEVKKRAKKNLKTIILPESEDTRVLEAAEKIIKEGFAKVILLGNEEKIHEESLKRGIDLDKVEILDPEKSSKREEYVQKLYELRKVKGLTLEEAEKLLLNPISLYF